MDGHAPSPTPRRRDPEATRAAILEAAEKLFVERGAAATSVRDIARLAGVTKSLIHHHFGSKEALWHEIKERHFHEYYDRQQRMLASSRGGADLLRDSIVTYFRFLQRNPDAVRFLGWRFLERDELCLDEEKELYELGIQRVREAQEAGELRDDLEPALLVKMFLGLVVHWFQSRALFCQMLEGEVDPEALEERYLEDLLRVYFRGILPRDAEAEGGG